MSTEPLARYRETENERASNLLANAVALARKRALEVAQQHQARLAVEPPRKDTGGGGLWGDIKHSIDKVTPDVLETPAKKTWEAIQYPGNFVVGAATEPFGRLEADGQGGVKRVFDARSLRSGLREDLTELGTLGLSMAAQNRVKREDALRQSQGLAKASSNPFKRFPNSANEFNASNVPTGVKIGTGVLLDPTNYVGAGLVNKVAKGPALLRGAASLLDSPAAVTAGAAIGSGGLAQIAESTGHKNLVGPAALAGGLFGGAGGGKVANAFRSAHTDATALREAARSQPPSPQVAGVQAVEDFSPPPPPPLRSSRSTSGRPGFMDAYGQPYPEKGKPFTENYERDLGAVARGRQALIDRLDSEASQFRGKVKRGDAAVGITPDMAKSAKDFINQVPEQYLERLGSSFVTLGGRPERTSGLPSNPGLYVAKQGSAYRQAGSSAQDIGLIRIVKGLAENQPDPDRVIIHEIAHHLEQFVSSEDATALRKEFRYELGIKGGVKLGKGLDTLKGVAEGDIPAYKGYRYKNLEGSFSEWFAENIADRALKAADGAETAGHWQRAWQAVKDIADTAYRWLTQKGDKGAADRVYQKILGGEYDAAVPENSISAKLRRGESADTVHALEDFSTPPLDKTSAYTILGASEGDDLSAIKSKYRKLMRQYHPDINKSASAADDAKAINNAFDQVVKDFDRFKWQGVPNGFTQGAGAAGTGTGPSGRPPGNGANAPGSGGPNPGARAGSGGYPPGGGTNQRGAPGTGANAGGNTGGPTMGAQQGGAGNAAPPPGGGNAPPPQNPGGGRPINSQPFETEDMFNTIDRSSRVAQEQRFVKSKRGRVDAGLRKVASKVGGEELDPNLKRDPEVTSFTVKEKNRLDNMVNSWESHADDLWNEVENSGIKVKPDANGDFRMENGVSFEDMAELSTPEGRQAYANLTHRQRQAVDALADFNERLNKNLRFHGGKNLPWDDTTMNFYFPHFGKGINGKQFVRGSGRGGSMLGGKGFPFHERANTTYEDAINAGLDLAHPQEAFRVMTRAKLNVAKNEYLAAQLRPLGVTQIPQGSHLGADYVQLSQNIAPLLGGRFFKPEDAKRIEAAFKGSPAFDVKPVRMANRALTPFRATGDISWFGQQGAAMLFRHPAEAVRGAGRVIQSAFGNREAYDKLIQSVDGFNKDEAIRHGLHWTGDDLSDIDYGFLKAPKTNKPGLKQVAKGYNAVANWSNETFSRYMNFARATYARDAQERLAKMKGSMSPEEWRKEYMSAMDAVNRVTGFTNRKPSSLESMALFAPRYTSATVEQIAAAVSKGGLEGSIARRQLGTMLAGGVALALAANQVSNNETDLDPRSPNFLRIRRLGGLDVSPFGSYDTLFRAIAATAAGEPEGKSKNLGPLKLKVPTGDLNPDITKLWRTAEAKMSPGLKLIYEPFFKKSTYTGEPLDPTSVLGLADIAAKEGVASLPFSIQNAVDEVGPAIKNRDPKEVLSKLPGEAVSLAGFANNPVTPSENRDFRRDDVAMERFGKKYADLTGTQKSIVNEDEKVTAFQDEANKNTLTRTDDRAKMQGAQLEAQSRIEAASQRFASGETTGSEFRDAYHDVQTWLAGNRDALGGGAQDDQELAAWFDLGKQARRSDGTTDYDQLDRLQAQFRQSHPNIDDKVDAVTGTHDNQVMRDFRLAQDEANQFYALPRYKGLSAADGERAGEILDLVRRLTANDQAANTAVALRYLQDAGAITLDDRRLALRASRLGTSKERQEFKRTHPLFARFYGDAVLSVNGVDAPEIGSQPDSSGGGGMPKPGQGAFGSRSSGVRSNKRPSLFSVN